MLTLMAARGLLSLRNRDLRKIIVASVIATSLATCFFLYRPFLKQWSAVNLKEAGQFLDTLDVDAVEVIAVPQQNYPVNPAVAVPLLDLSTHKRILYHYVPGASTPDEDYHTSRFRDSWEYQNPPYYESGAGQSAGKKAVAVILADVNDKDSSRINGYNRKIASYEIVYYLFPLFSQSHHCADLLVTLRGTVTEPNNEILILGGGLTGLSAGYVLSKAGLSVTVFEHDSTVGGISKTIEHNGFRFDIGPHRFFTKDPRLEAFVKDLMGDELITVPRKTKIFIRGKYFDYPLEPVNAVFGMGLFTTLRILGDYGLERIKRLFRNPEPVSLEDWVVANFGRTLFDIYFKEYSEKVWGIPCSAISAEWVARRIKGLSLSSAVANAFFKIKGRDIPSLVDEFLYPRTGHRTVIR